MSLALSSPMLIRILLFVVSVVAASDDDNNTHHISTGTAVIGIIIAVALFFILCCGTLSRRRALAARQANAGRPPTSAPLNSWTSNAGFPHGMQYGGNPYRSAPGTPMAHPQNPTSEYVYPPPLTGSRTMDGEWAPPPYVKEDLSGPNVQYAPPPGPPPAPGAPYSPPPGGPPPPAAAHVATHSGDFSR
ncbi:hypothetical protein MIND_00574400 [Mycena indigotica]|uniref:Uncharacterized protein n=1 Tax=Mycena indigotica TaxID=2126181 RepID=A0A8H6SQ37_9AGAR|nr:uncharacterized protein MIND_00574400 [Mycena indigotica]KAF7303456.1 hypothetical protein MIND_00574400 [Mycena indigotica]